MFYITICDDNKTICAEIENILIDNSKKSSQTFTIEVFYHGEHLLNYLQNGNFFDLIFLDIELGKINGLEIAQWIRKEMHNYRTEIVFISGKEGFDRQLFEFQPLHLIPKPIDAAQIISDLQLALFRSNKLNKQFLYKKNFQQYRVPISEILYFQSFNRETIMITDQGTEIFYSTLDNIEAQLCHYHFYRIQRSFLINCNRILIIRYAEVVMSNGQVLPISKSKKKEFRNFQLNVERGTL